MQFKRIAIRNFRRLQQPVRIDGLGSGINVIAGENEEGKSTVLRALRAGLFDKHSLSGEAAASLQPYGAQVRPEVELDFSLAGIDYRLSKGFCQRPAAELVGPGERHEGPAAEDRLKELLGFEHPGRGAGDARHQGIWGLLWVEQGTAFGPIQHNDRSRRSLQSTLESEVGDILGGQRGHTILETVRSAYAVFFTATGRPRGEYKAATEQVEALSGELAAAEAQLASYEAKVDRLQHLQDALRRWDEEKILERQKARLTEAERSAAALGQLQEALNAAEARVHVAEAQGKLAASRWTQRRELSDELARHVEQAEKLTQQLATARRAREDYEPVLAQQATTAAAAAASLTQAQSQLERAQAQQRRLALNAALAELHGRREQAVAAAGAANTAQAQAESIKTTRDGIDNLRELSAQRLRAEAQLAAGSPELVFDLNVDVSRGGEPVPRGKRLTVDDRSEFTLAGLGTITVAPAGKDLHQARQQVQALRQQQSALLAQLGVADPAAAEQEHRRREQLLQEAQNQRALLTAHAPKGVEALEGEIARHQAELDRLGAVEAQGEIDPREADRAVQHAQTELERAKAEAEDADARLQAARNQADSSTQRLSELATRLASSQEEQQRAARLLEAARAQESDESLARAVAQSEGVAAEAAAALTAARQALDAAEPERVRLELERAADALSHSQQQHQRRRLELRELQVELQALGHTGLGERRQELQAELEQARLHAEHLEREAQALRVLREVLEDCARRAGEAFLAPVLDRVQPYLRLLMPADTELVLDSELRLIGIRRGGVEEPFDGLSLGTREQLAVITRLAFADLLHEQGQPVAVVLDDALVYADDERFERMQLILRKAAERYQVLILTCRERDYLNLGAKIIRLADCREPATESA